ncbi:MAG TPA: metallophosphoesterase [Micromonosporaceae bacterium]
MTVDQAPAEPATFDPDNAPRPTALEPRQIGFTPRKPVPWLAPVLLAGTAVRVLLAELFGAYLDKRELQNALPARVYDERPPGDDPDTAEVWFDYIADLGDGFDPTYSMAWLLAQPELEVDGESTPRGRFVVLGGDQVYPTASWQQYEDRFKGPYRAALPHRPEGHRPTLYALPGNHDWYDGLTAFLRIFAKANHGDIGGWRTRQSRSYFAIQLPHRWWIFAIDAQFGAYLDDPQMRYFHDAAQQLQPGDRVILCPPSPGWVEAQHDPHAYDTIDYFVRTVLAPRGVDVKLMISGDLHHYARYTGPDRELITCGGGGAYLYGTHHLPESIPVPPPSTLVRNATPTKTYTLTTTYPTKSASRRFAAGVFGRLPWRNPGFVTLLGTLHMLLMLALANATERVASGTEQRLVTIPVALMVLILLGGCAYFSMPPTGGRAGTKHWLLGLGHGLVQCALGLAGTWVWTRLPLSDLPWPLPLLAAALLYLPIVGLLSTEVVCGYLLFASVFDVNVNELFAGQSIVDAKGFLRLHIDADGVLTVYPVAVDRVSRRWTPKPDAAPDAPWFDPAEPLRYRLAESPIRIR